MFKYIIAIALIGAVCANDDVHARVNHEFRKDDEHGNFDFGFDLTNGIAVEEHGNEHGVHGEYHYVSKEGVPVKITYTADDHGYHPQGDLLPTAPPTPAAILKALKYIEEHPSKPDPVVHHQTVQHEALRKPPQVVHHKPHQNPHRPPVHHKPPSHHGHHH